jgi:hypothetical protein
MSITRLQQARQMYALGQRVAKTLDGSRPGYRGEGGYGDGSEEGTNSGGANSGGADDRSSAAQTASHNAAVSAAQDYNRAENAKNKTIFGFEKPPSVFDRIGTGIKNYVTSGGLLGMGIRGITGLVDKFTGPPDLGIRDGYNMANIAGPKSYDFGPGPGEGNDNQQLYATTNQYPITGTIPEEGIATLLNSMPQDPFKSRYLQSQPKDIREAIEASMQNYYT